MDILVVNGPNINALGTREPEVYGRTTLPELEAALVAQGADAGLGVDTFQSNHEGAIIDRLYEARTDGTRFIIINPGGLTHTSIALRDALAGIALPFIEVHISNTHAREEFRQHSYLSDLASGILIGFGTHGYHLAMNAVIHRLTSS